MHTYEIVEPALIKYKNAKLTPERIEFLKTQANEQIEEIKANEVIYNSFLEKVQAPEKIDTIILWMLFMSNEDIVEEYVDTFSKPFMDIIPVSDLADLLFYLVYMKKIENTAYDGFDYLLQYEEEGIDDMDQYCFTNVLVYIQTMKKLEEMDF
jgi:adenine specific DNA methylase Mod